MTEEEERRRKVVRVGIGAPAWKEADEEVLREPEAAPGAAAPERGPTPGRGFGGRVMVEVEKEDEGSRRTEEARRVWWCRRRRRRGMKRRSGDGRQRRSSSKGDAKNLERRGEDDTRSTRARGSGACGMHAHEAATRARHRLGSVG